MSNEPVGAPYEFELGELRGRFTFVSPKNVRFQLTSGAGFAPDDHDETVEVTVVDVRPGVLLSSWTEASGTTVVHLIDFDNGELYSRATTDGVLHTMSGTLTPA